ncbi:MAG: TIR domain-containing protein [Spirosomaceae bacterium]|jgi:hypothetical protein|nr:TIR domain-containing protein [Spirosomataceae bacterium]
MVGDKIKRKAKNVFISHFGQDEEHIGRLKTLLRNRGYQLKNSSIDSTKPNQASNPDYIKRLLRLRIHWSGTVIVLVGPETHTRPWVDWEIEQAHKKGKRIVGVYINGAGQSDIPEKLAKYGHAMVGWTGNKIIEALEGGGTPPKWEDGENSSWNSPFTRIVSNC